MASLEDHSASDRSTGILIGAPGSGKTGSLVSLAEAGYKLRIMDFDGGTQILAQLLKGTPYLKNVDVESFRDVVQAQAGTGMPKVVKAEAFEKALICMTKWPGLGSPTTWGPDTILVTDSITMQGRATMAHVSQVKGKLQSMKKEDMHPSQPDWGDAMDFQEKFIAQITSPGLSCHSLMTSHVTVITPEGQVTTEGYPSGLGSKWPPKIGGYFNMQLAYTLEGVGAGKRRVISTRPTGIVTTKVPTAPSRLKASYPIETGLAEIFKELHGPLKT